MSFQIATYRFETSTDLVPYDKVSGRARDWCRHLEYMVVVKRTSDGRDIYRERCAFCFDGKEYGQCGIGIKRAIDKWGPVRVEKAFDHDAYEYMHPQDRLDHFKGMLFKIRYQEHLSSKRWAKIRDSVFARSGGKCERCDSAARHVHHKTYENLGNEPLKDLEAICIPCHDKHHDRVF